MISFRDVTDTDGAAIWQVVEQAFGRRDEAILTEQLIRQGKGTVSMAAVLDNRIVGHILYSQATVESPAGNFTILCIAPVSVLPQYQRQGIGSSLIRESLERCRSLGYEVVVLVGHPEYYPRFGFVRASSFGLKCEFEAPDQAWMALELRPGALASRTGIVKFQPEFQDVTQVEH